MSKIKKYKFILLRDEACDTDLFEDKTHEKIAESLFELIENEEKSISIGFPISYPNYSRS